MWGCFSAWMSAVCGHESDHVYMLVLPRDPPVLGAVLEHECVQAPGLPKVLLRRCLA